MVDFVVHWLIWQMSPFLKYSCIADNPLYTDTRYNDKIRYKGNLTVTNLRLIGINY